MAPTTSPKRSAPQASHTTTFLFFAIILIAFFPGIFHYLWSLPLALLPASWATLIPSNPLTGPPPPQITDTTDSSRDPATAPAVAMGSWFQKQFTLPSQSKGSYLVTDIVVEALPELKDYKVGILHLFVQHTSCALSLNENWDEDVRADMSDALDRIAPESGAKGKELYRHSAEGPDDMPAHVKSALIGASVTIPIRDGKLATGTWQGIWYLEFRAARHQRRVVATIQGEKK